MTNKKATPKADAESALRTPGEYAFDGLDRIMHEKARLGIMTSLMNWPNGLIFSELKSLCSLTDGNLNRHLQTLEEAELIEIWKGQRGQYSQTLIRMTQSGREKFLAYLQELERVIQQAAAMHQSTTPIHGNLGTAARHSAT
jgi:DNA-binding MarR family transcriptional regulator